MSTGITEEQVREIARLAKLEFEDKELPVFADELENIVEMVEKLEQVNTKNVPGTYHGVVLDSVMREDKAEEGTDRDELFANVKETEEGFIKVPAMIDNGEAGA